MSVDEIVNIILYVVMGVSSIVSAVVSYILRQASLRLRIPRLMLT